MISSSSRLSSLHFSPPSARALLATLLFTLYYASQEHNSYARASALMIFAPPQKYSIPPVTNGELIKQLKGLSRKANELRAHWFDSNSADGGVTEGENMRGGQTPPPAQQPMTSLTPGRLDREGLKTGRVHSHKPHHRALLASPQQLIHRRPSPSEIQLGIFEGGNGQQQSRPNHPAALPAQDYSIEGDEPASSLEAEKVGHRHRSSVVRDCLFHRSGCVNSGRLDRARTLAYLDKMQALLYGDGVGSGNAV